MEDGAEEPRDPGRNRGIRNFSGTIERFDERGVGGMFDPTVVDEADACDRPGIGAGPREDVEFDVLGCFIDDRTGAGGGTSGEADRWDGVS